MPKQVNFVPNERVDLDDLAYGTSTFPVDSLKAHVQRLISGDYTGGFVLEGFRVEIDLSDLGDRRIYVHNGIAIDRDGRLITFEDGDNFSKNIDIKKEYILDNNPVNHYIMVEFAFDDVDDDTRAVWDPTYENANIIDSAGNTHAAPNGREFPLNIPTRRALSWRIVSETGSFDDRGDLGTEGHTLRIPIAIIKVFGGAIDLTVSGFDLENPWTTVIETPQPGDTILVCANTRLFGADGQVEILDRFGGSSLGVGVRADYGTLDDDNNVIAGIDNVGTLLTDVKAGDIVHLVQTPIGAIDLVANLLQAGNRWDARPMLFSFTDPVADSEETDTLKRNPRNQRFAAGIALLRKYVTSTTTVDFPSATATSYKLQLTDNPDRVEDNLKQEQDFFRAMGAIVREMKYGEPIHIEAQSTLLGPNVSDLSGFGVWTNTATKFAISIASDHPQFYSGLNTFLIGATLEFTSGALPPDGPRTVTDISSIVYNDPGNPTWLYYVITVDAVFSVIPATGDLFSLTKEIASNTKFVDNYNIGNLNEVYRARIDRVTNSWTSDLQERLAANKVPVVTVGDGLNTFGDFNGNGGLEQAFDEVSIADVGGVIYIKRGSYEIDGLFTIKSNTTVMGEGSGATTITYADTSTLLLFAGTSDSCQNVQFKDISILAASYAGGGAITGKGIILSNDLLGPLPVKNLTIDNCYMEGGSYYNNTALPVADREKRNVPILHLGIQNSNTVANSNIKILNSTFFIAGGGFYLQGCRNVQIDGCIFETETNITGSSDFIGLVEGITFDGGSPFNAASEYGHSSGALVEGEVSVSNCKFRGPHTELSVLPYRGWIFFSPTFTGQNSSVTNCQFIGDTEGDDGPAGPPRYRAAQSQWGIGISSVSGEPLFISGCVFHSYNEGIRCALGKTSINDCLFVACDNGVVSGHPPDGIYSNDFDYVNVDPNWVTTTGLITSVDFFTEVKGCSFTSYFGKFDRGIRILPQALLASSQLFSDANVCITNCNFKQLLHAIDYDLITTLVSSSLTIAKEYESIEIDSCSFNDIYGNCLRGGQVVGNTRLIAYSNIEWAIQLFTYTNNLHKNISTHSAIVYDAINISGKRCNISNNYVEDMIPASGIENVFDIQAPDVLIFENNKMVNCQPLVNDATVYLNHVSIDIVSATPQLTISGNVINNDSAAADIGICNGIKVYTTNNLAGVLAKDSIFPTLMMQNNNFAMKNANYVFLASQDDVPGGGVTATRLYLWRSVTVFNNVLSNEVDSARIPNFSSYSNDSDFNMPGVPAPAPPVQYLGGESNYCGILDLRLFDIRSSFGASETHPSCTIVGNRLSLNYNSAWDMPNPYEKDKVMVAGIRISHWPTQVKISDNTIFNVPIICNNNWWNSRNDVSHPQVGTSIDISNNSIKIENVFSCAVDVTPATGVVPAGGSFPSFIPEYQTRVLFTSNTISTFSGQNPLLVTSYSRFLNVVRFGQLEGKYQAFPVVADDQINTDELFFSWQISNNILDSMPIIIGYGQNTGGSATQAAEEEDGDYLGLLTFAFGGGAQVDWAGGSATSTLPTGERLIVVQNNQFSFLSGQPNPGHMFGTTKRLGVARFYTGNLLAGVIEGSFGSIYGNSMDLLPDTVGTTPIGTLVHLRSAVIVENNSCVDSTPTALYAGGTKHAFTGSLIDQG